MTFIKNFFDAFWTTLQALFSWMLDGGLLVIKAALYAPFDGFLTIISAFIHAIDFSSIMIVTVIDWASLPPQLIYLINAVGFPQGISIILAALVIRLTLNLIPSVFTRV